MTPPKGTAKPHDRLTRICDAMTATMDQHPEVREGDKCMVFLDDGKRGGIQLHGYRDTEAALEDLMMHLVALFEANGLKIAFVPVEAVGQG